MQVYLVGGAVRDELLGLPVTERDWVVVGANPDQMEAQGYKTVGKDFPVFLHPQSKEEYALARTERKKGRGYHGFEIHASPEVTLEEDLRRRDLTINAIARSDSGEIIDPYDGQSDLENKVLRHVSEAFAEDPLRVIRVARFAAKFHSLGFSIAKETQQLMRHIVTTREILELSPERIWQETRKALCMPSPEQFFLVLHSCGALTQTHPSISDQFANHEAQQLGLSALDNASRNEEDPCIRLATFLGGLFYHNLENSHDDIQALCEKLVLPKACKELLLLTASTLNKCQHAFELNAVDLLSLLRSMDVKRKPQRFEELLRIFGTVHSTANNDDAYPQADFLLQASHIIEEIDIELWIREKVSHEELANNIKNSQHELLKKLIQDRNSWVEKK